jgi:hypothetical protein
LQKNLCASPFSKGLSINTVRTTFSQVNFARSV